MSRALGCSPPESRYLDYVHKAFWRNACSAFVYISFAAVVVQIAFGFASMVRAGDPWQQVEIERATLGALFGMILDGYCLYLLAVQVHDRRQRQRGCFCGWDGWRPMWCSTCVNEGVRQL